MEKMKKITLGVLAVTFLFLGTVGLNGTSDKGMSPQEIVVNA